MNSRMIIHCLTYFGFLLLLRTTISSTTPEDNLKKLAVANNEFALNLHKKLAGGSEKNIFFSPLSLSTAFGMLYYGVRGESAEELRNVLGYQKAGLTDASVHFTFKRLMSETKSSSNNEYTLNSANAILVDNHLNLNTEYKTTVQDLYLAPVRAVNFLENGQAIVDDINKWVKSKTRGKIRRLVSRIDPLTVMILLNAVYFKGQWETPFHPRATRSSTFYNGGLETGAKAVSMMRHPSARFPYATMPDFEALELPYEGNHLSMLILLPKQRNGLTTLENSMTNEKLDIIRQNMSLRRVDVYLPKFKIEFEKNLKDELKALGTSKIFQAGSDDFSGISEKESKRLLVSHVLHKSVVEVNEEGTTAAAATSIIVMVRTGSKQFRADHPFLFFIIDKRSNLILFMGSVRNL